MLCPCRETTRTTVAIVGGGPAGLMLSHLLSLSGIESVVIDVRTRREIEETHRAGILEQDSVRMLVDTGVSDRVLRDGYRHEGIELAFGGERTSHRLPGTGGRLGPALPPDRRVHRPRRMPASAMAATCGSGSGTSSVADVTSDSPAMLFTDADGQAHEVRCDYLVGSDGSRSICRQAFPDSLRRQYFREYPFAWFGILCEAPPSAPELIYNHSDRGFALISQRTDTLQRMYFQCDVDTDVADWSDDRIWEELQARLGANGYTLKEGPITSKMVLPFRSFVQEPMRYGNLLLAGDAAHTVPPTGAKGLNLALADVRVLAEELERAINKSDGALLDDYTTRALDRVWKAQHFSYWMTTMLHLLPESSPFDVRRQIGELSSLTSSRAGSTYLAEAYTGWPSG